MKMGFASRLIWALLIMVTCSSCLAQRSVDAPGAQVAKFDTDAFATASGLRVVLERAPERGVSGVVLLIRSGAAAEPAGQAGLAHLTEHLVFQARHRDQASIWNRLGALGGGAFNGMTSWDYTAYYAFVPSDSHAELLKLMSEVLSDPLAGVDDDAFFHELAIVDNERRVRTENGTPGEALGHLAAATFAPQHPYSRPVVGTKASLSRLTLEQARTFASRHYRAENVILISVAPGTTALHRRRVDENFLQHFAGRRALQEPAKPPAPTPAPQHRLRRHQALVPSKTLWVGWPLPADFEQSGDIPELLTSLLEGTFWSNVQDRDRDIADVSAGYLSGRDASLFYIKATLTKGDDPEAALQSLLGRMGPGLVERIHQRTWFESYKRHVATENTYATENLVHRTLDLALSAHQAGFPEYLRERGQRLLRLDDETVRRFMDQFLAPENARAVLLEPVDGRAADVPLGERRPSLERDAQAANGNAPVPPARREWMQSVDVRSASRLTLKNGLNVIVLPDRTSPFHTAFLGFHGAGFTGPMRAAASAASWARSYRSLSPSVKGRLSRDGMETDALWTMVRSTGSDIAGTLHALHEQVTGFSIDWPPPQFRTLSQSLEQEENAPRETWFRQRHAALFGGHPYAAQTRVAAMRKVTATHIYQVLAELRQPKNALLVIVGDVEQARALASARQLFENWHASGSNNQLLPAPDPLGQLPQGAPGLVKVDWPAATLASLGLDCVLPPTVLAKSQAKLDLFRTVTERFMRARLRSGASEAYAVDVDMRRMRAATSVLSITTSVTHTRLSMAFQVLEDFLNTPAAHWISEELIESARSQLSRQYNLSHLTTASLARRVFDTAQSGWEISSLDAYPDHLLATQKDEVTEVADHCRRHGFLSALSDPARTPPLTAR